MYIVYSSLADRNCPNDEEPTRGDRDIVSMIWQMLYRGQSSHMQVYRPSHVRGVDESAL